MKKLEMLLEGMYFVPQVVPEIQNKTIEALENKGYQFINWIKPASPTDEEDGKGAAILTKRTSKFSSHHAEVEPDGSINGEAPEKFLARENKAATPIHMDEYALAMGIKPKSEMTTAGIPEDTAEAMSGISEKTIVRGKEVDVDSIELDEGEGHAAKAVKAHYMDGTPLTKEELNELNNPGTSTGVPNVKQQPDLVRGVPATVIGETEALKEVAPALMALGRVAAAGFGAQAADRVADKLGLEEDESDEISPAALEKGAKHEMEHTKDPLVAKKIAMDHLRDDPHYYEKLAKAGLEEAPAPATAPTKPATPTIPGTPTTKPGHPHPLTPTRPGISPRPKAEGTQDDVQKFVAKRTQYKQ